MSVWVDTKRANFLDYNENDFKNYVEYLTHDGDQFYDRNFLNRINKQSQLIRNIALAQLP